MIQQTQHNFHIPVMGLGYTIDTPVKVARFGISSVISIVEDELTEQMRCFYCEKYLLPFHFISNTQHDYRAKRIEAYLNLIKQIVDAQVVTLKELPFENGAEINLYFELLPDSCKAKKLYYQMLQESNETIKKQLQAQLREAIVPGAIDVNLMSKVDKNNYSATGELLPPEYTDAAAGLRGFANSKLGSSVVFSAGYNPRLYSYLEQLPAFYPTKENGPQKKVILKVSDYRSALVQGKILAKKGILVAEFRIESGLNCGGHAFATDGLLLGPIMEEFKNNKTTLQQELFTMCNAALAAKEKPLFKEQPTLRITVQGGIGTAAEQQFLLDYYGAESTGWGSPFLLIPEVTNVDAITLEQLACALPEDYYTSNISPLGVPFNSFKKASSETERTRRIDEGRPGNPCTKKYLISNTEFTELPICTASRKYQNLKLQQLSNPSNAHADIEKEKEAIMEKDCLCEGLGNAALAVNDIPLLRKANTGIIICPGPNLAYFSGIFSLQQMVDHIYGRTNILNEVPRSHMFINELNMYISYFENEIVKNADGLNAVRTKQLHTFHENLLKGIAYYRNIATHFKKEAFTFLQDILTAVERLDKVVETQK